MPVYECCGCPSGPCTLVNMDPEFEPGSECMDIRCQGSTIAVWRELKVSE
jgi:hypothetical protein